MSAVRWVLCYWPVSMATADHSFLCVCVGADQDKCGVEFVCVVCVCVYAVCALHFVC